MAVEITTFKAIYNKYFRIFKEKIKEEYIDLLFNKNKDNQIELKTVHSVEGEEPEALTQKIIIEMLRELEITC